MTEQHLAELAEEYENVRPIPARTHVRELVVEIRRLRKTLTEIRDSPSAAIQLVNEALKE